MVFKRALLSFGAALILGSAPGAMAADLGSYDAGSIKDAPYVHDTGPRGWYLRVDGGYAAYGIDDPNFVDLALTGLAVTPFTSTTSDIDNGWTIGGGIGKYFGGGFRGDLTLEYRGKVDVSATADASCCDVSTETEVDGLVGLANLYYDFNRGGRFVPYVGAGIGFARLETDGGTLGCAHPTIGCTPPPNTFGDATYGKHSETNFAVAGMAGVSMKLRGGEPTFVDGGMKDAPVMVSGGRGLYLDVGYRFLYLGDIEAENARQTSGNEIEVGWDSLTSHEVRVGLRADLN